MVPLLVSRFVDATAEKPWTLQVPGSDAAYAKVGELVRVALTDAPTEARPYRVAGVSAGAASMLVALVLVPVEEPAPAAVLERVPAAMVKPTTLGE